eukprot:925245-Pelagomonas_calceolata.AAC.8
MQQGMSKQAGRQQQCRLGQAGFHSCIHDSITVAFSCQCAIMTLHTILNMTCTRLLQEGI